MYFWVSSLPSRSLRNFIRPFFKFRILDFFVSSESDPPVIFISWSTNDLLFAFSLVLWSPDRLSPPVLSKIPKTWLESADAPALGTLGIWAWAANATMNSNRKAERNLEQFIKFDFKILSKNRINGLKCEFKDKKISPKPTKSRMGFLLFTNQKRSKGGIGLPYTEKSKKRKKRILIRRWEDWPTCPKVFFGALLQAFFLSYLWEVNPNG